MLVNEVLRFCPNVSVELPPSAHELVPALELLSVEIHGSSTIALGTSEGGPFDAVVSIGTEIRAVANWITINSDSWLCRLGTSNSKATTLPHGYTLANPFGALEAACLGAGQAFLALSASRCSYIRSRFRSTHSRRARRASSRRDPT